MTYQTYQWSELDERTQADVIRLHADSWNVEPDRTPELYHVFNMGNPCIVLDSMKRYCRIDTKNVDEMKFLLRQYLDLL